MANQVSRYVKEYRRNEDNLRMVPDVLPLVIGINLLTSVILAVYILLTIVTGIWGTSSKVSLVIMCCLLIYSRFTDFYYDWEHNVVWGVTHSNKVHYMYDLVGNIGSKDKTVKISLDTVTDFKFHKRRKSVVLKGSFTKSIPMRGNKKLSKVCLKYDISTEKDIKQLLKTIKE